jgi:hypothetical protein
MAAGYAQPVNSDRPGLAGVPTTGTGSGAAAPAIGDEQQAAAPVSGTVAPTAFLFRLCSG